MSRAGHGGCLCFLLLAVVLCAHVPEVLQQVRWPAQTIAVSVTISPVVPVHVRPGRGF